ncbi:hypothetical protein CTEN210_12942 [Chaetoceros tenuissimus]|uniref:Ankyrin repeat-containing domain n=1 Tax=Chaetoceros tenuissimus TaxID=426638 RepID=A0AAD3D489_9STRA|nr:hypothetical protein CTEN210_12942 [Chaetoceros tenuissimus]
MPNPKRIKVAHGADEDMTSSTSDVIKHIQDLPSDVFQHCLEFVGKGNFAFVAPVSKHFYWNYINLGVEMKNNVIDVDVILQQGRNKKTTADVLVASTDSLRLATECFLKAPAEFQLDVCRHAAVNGRLDILKCAVAFGIDMKNSVFPDRTSCGAKILWMQLAETAANGHLEIMQFLHDQGINLDRHDIMWEIAGERRKSSCLHWMVYRDIVFNYLVRDGEIDILKEHYKDSAKHVDEYTFDDCAEGGSIEVMNWLLGENDCEWDSSLFSKAAKSGSIPMMELCLQNGCPPSEDICSSAMENKNHEAALDALKWLPLKWARENGCSWDEKTFLNAAKYGNVDVLEYYFENNCLAGHVITYPVALDYDHFDYQHSNPTEMEERSLKVYKWLHQRSFPWDDTASLEAVKERHWETFMWAIENGCPLHEDILGRAIGDYNIAMVEYCLQHLPSTDDTIYLLALNKMNEDHERRNITDSQMINMLQKIHDRGIPWSRDIIACAERLGRSNVANWLRCIGCPH